MILDLPFEDLQPGDVSVLLDELAKEVGHNTAQEFLEAEDLEPEEGEEPLTVFDVMDLLMDSIPHEEGESE